MPFEALWSVWSTWWLGDIGGVLIVAPFLLVLAAWRRSRPQPRDIAEALGLLAALDVLERAVALARRQEWEVAVLFVDIDGFTDTNDGFGHHAGDEVLIETARRLRSAIRASDTVARLGGDEFAVLLAGSTSAGEAAQTAQRVLEHLRRPLAGVGTAPLLSASVGVAVQPADDETDAHEFLKQADTAPRRPRGTAAPGPACRAQG